MIKFGTSGWRGVIAEDFTFPNVRRAVQAIAFYLARKGGDSIVVGYDTRFLSEDFAEVAARVLVGNGLRVYLSKSDIPTPTVAYETVSKKASGAINFTASHNDYIYNGLKFSSSSGGPALPQETKQIEEIAYSLTEKQVKIFQGCLSESLVEYFDGQNYLESLKNMVDLHSIARARKKVVYEAFYGTGRVFVPRILSDITEFSMINGYRDPLFGKKHPEPIEGNLRDLSECVKESNADIGIATDGDGDRFGFVDQGGTYLSPNMVLPIVYKYLLDFRKMRGNVSRTISTTTMLDRIAKKYGFEAVETPVGFKFIGETIVNGECIFGGEESGGASMKGWLAEKDGILMNALMVEIISVTNKTLLELYKDIVREFGEVFSKRLDFEFKGDRTLSEKKLIDRVSELKSDGIVLGFSEMDGLKVFFEKNNWILFRFSGTEPKVRIYLESDSASNLAELEKMAKNLFSALEEV